jgi:hypothetical protein
LAGELAAERITAEELEALGFKKVLKKLGDKVLK